MYPKYRYSRMTLIALFHCGKDCPDVSVILLIISVVGVFSPKVLWISMYFFYWTRVTIISHCECDLSLAMTSLLFYIIIRFYFVVLRLVMLFLKKLSHILQIIKMECLKTVRFPTTEEESNSRYVRLKIRYDLSELQVFVPPPPSFRHE
jgi:hypothetical protein